MREYICIHDEDKPNPYPNNNGFIRCKDCKHFDADLSSCDYGAFVTSEYFCSRAERTFVLRLEGNENASDI